MDWGVARFFTLSDGQYKEQCAPLKAFLPKLARLQRRLARKKKFSSNRKKAKARITKLHSKIANIRKDFVHKASNDISKNHAVVCIEDLQVRNTSASAAGTKDQPGKHVRAKSGLNRSILDASPKTVWRGGLLIPVPAQRTSRFCPCCEHDSKDNRKSQSEFVCVECGFSENADWVGAINTKRLGIASFVCSLSSGDVAETHREDPRGSAELVGIPRLQAPFKEGRMSTVLTTWNGCWTTTMAMLRVHTR
jgi:putative transposase